MAWSNFKDIGGSPSPNRCGSGGRKRERPPKTRDELERALAASERAAALSREIRAQAGLPPVEPNGIADEWRRMLAATSTPKVARGKARLSLTDRVGELERRWSKHNAEAAAIDAEAVALMALAQSEPSVTVRAVAQARGVSRQRLYQLAS